jgi:hypothetical protein
MKPIYHIFRFILMIALFILTACAREPVLTITAPRSETVLKTSIPTQPSTATTIPQPTATHIPSATPTYTVEQTADFSNLRECRTWWEAIEKCQVSLEDLKSGKLVDFAKKVTQPFPPDAYRAYPEKTTGYTTRVYNPEMVYQLLPLEFVPSTEGVDDKTAKWMRQGVWGVNNAVFSSPLSPIGDKLFFWVKGKENSELPFDLMVMVTKLKTKSGKDGYYIVVRPPSLAAGEKVKVDMPATRRLYSQWIDKMAYQPPLYNPAEWYGDPRRWNFTTLSSYMDLIIDDSNGWRKRLMDEWIDTGDIPEELEKVPLFAFISGSKDFPWEIKVLPRSAYPKNNTPTPLIISTQTPPD